VKRRASLLSRAQHYLPPVALSCALGCGFVGIDVDGDQARLSTDRTGTGGRSSSLPDRRLASGADGGRVDGPLNRDAGADAGGDAADGGDGPDAGLPRDAGPLPADAGSSDAGAGATRCAPDCTCSAGNACDLACGAASCTPSCDTDTSCRIRVENAVQVVIACAAGATCRATGPRSDTVAFVCIGAGNCTAECQGAASCSIDCQGTGACSLDCGDAQTCTLQCSSESSCLLAAHNDQTQLGVECAGQVPTTICSELVLACNANCPQ
jgi:hypothetical protein